MKSFLWFAVVGAVMCANAPALAASTCAPAKMVHWTTVEVTPGMPAGSFAALPKSFYRVGSDKFRVEEQLDTSKGIHALVVAAEPNIWMVNLYDSTGRHIVDPGPTFYARAPVFGIKGVPPKLLELEFGCEATFLSANAPKPDRTEQISNVTYDVFKVADGTEAIEILERPGSGIPSYARYYHEGKVTMALRYDLYQTGLASEPNLFVAPPNIKYTEEKPG
jgi:hypothetical protein